MYKAYLPIEKLKNWSKNPKILKKDDFKRLKAQIKKLGEYKPLIVNHEGEVLGGNSRLLAYKELGYDKCWVSLVTANSDEIKLKYALSDNDRVGYYVEKSVLDTLRQNPDLDPSQFSLNFGYSKGLDALLNRFSPSDEVQTDNSYEAESEGVIKQIMIAFEGDQFVNFMERIQKVRDKNNLKNSTEVLVFLINHYQKQNGLA